MKAIIGTIMSPLRPNMFFGNRGLLVTVLALLAAALLSGCSGALELAGGWPDSEIIIDGKSGDWIGATTYDKAQDVSIGARNDADFLYICFITSNRMTQRQIIASGLSVWLDPTGKNEKTFGIQFPIGVLRDPRRPGAQGSEVGVQRPNVDRLHTELEILNSDPNNRLRLSFAELKGIELRMNTSGSSLVYELKVPLKQSERYPYAIGQGEFTSVAIGFETALVAPEGASRANTPTGGGAAGIRGAARGNRPAGARPEAGMQGERLEPLDFWARVELAKKAE